VNAAQVAVGRLSDTDIQRALRGIRKRNARNYDTLGLRDHARVFAVLKECLYRQFGISAYSAQLACAIALLRSAEGRRGALAQVATGEGKSTIVALMAGYHGIFGHAVDVVSSSSTLARRDAAKYARYYAMLGLKSAHICTRQPQPESFAANIVFGTSAEFRFSLMREGLQLSDEFGASCRLSRPCDVVLVDEVDNLLLDKSLSPAVMAGGRPGIVSNELLAEVFHFCAARPNERNGSVLYRQHHSGILQTSAFDSRSAYLQVKPARLEALFESCAHALHSCQENIDYVVVAPKDVPNDAADNDEQDVKQIVIVDQHDTGELLWGHRWENGRHEFLEMKHGLIASSGSSSYAQMRSREYFLRYGRIFGLTGTIGAQSERHEIGVDYNLELFDVPPHRPNIRRQLPEQVLSTQPEYLQAVESDIRRATMVGQPALVLSDTIEASRQLRRYLQGTGMASQLLDGLQQDETEVLLARAGLSGVVTLATNLAGRGTDIVLSRESLAAGGLHVIVAFFPESERVQRQALGRAGRQGQPGSGRLIVLASALEDASFACAAENIAALRRLKEEKQSLLGHQRAAADRRARPYALLQEQWFTALTTYTKTIDQKWLLEFAQMPGAPRYEILVGLRSEVLHELREQWAQIVDRYGVEGGADGNDPVHHIYAFERLLKSVSDPEKLFWEAPALKNVFPRGFVRDAARRAK
jgi:preprotein translocase subunit SecA